MAVPEPPGSRRSSLNAPIHPPPERLDCAHWLGASRVRDTQSQAHKSIQLYRKTGNLRACQLLLGHTKLESTVRYLGVELDDALALCEALEI